MAASLTVGSCRIEVARCDLLTQEVDAIVNPANEQLAHGGGLAAIIARAAGPELVRQSDAHPRVRTGKAGVTAAGALPQLAVIHAVGPVWRGGDHGEPALLAGAHTSALAVASDRGHRSVAFPAISCGVFGYPATEAASVAVNAVAQALAHDPGSVRLVRFCLASAPHEQAFTAALEETRGATVLE